MKARLLPSRRIETDTGLNLAPGDPRYVPIYNFMAEWDESKHKRATDGKFGTNGHVSTKTQENTRNGSNGKSTDTRVSVEKKADQIASQIEKKSSSIWAKAGKAGKFFKDKTKAVYQVLEKRYGRNQAIAIFAAGHVVGIASPLVVLPGSTLLGMVPFAAMAEVYLQAKRGIQAIRHDEQPTLTEGQIRKLGTDLFKLLTDQWEKVQGKEFTEDTVGIYTQKPKRLFVAHAEDASGHEHKGKGPGGGQFTKGSGGSSGESKKETSGKEKFIGATVGHKERALADKVEQSIAAKLGHNWESDYKPYDTVSKNGKSATEVKTMPKGTKTSISVHEDALLRKADWLAANPGAILHTVVSDQRGTYDDGAYKDNYSGHDLYYKRGVGRYALSKMYKCKNLDELKRLEKMPTADLPPAARGEPNPEGGQVPTNKADYDKLKALAATADASRKVRDAKRRAKAKAEGWSVYERRT